jgi:hypothetical protein
MLLEGIGAVMLPVRRGNSMEHTFAGGACDVSALIGALEIGVTTPFFDDSVDDSVLETAIQAGPSTLPPSTRRLLGRICLQDVGDAALEAAMTVSAGPTSNPGFPVCSHFMEDGALENAAQTYAGPPSTLYRLANGPCYGISDDALETVTRNVSAGPTSMRSPMCPNPYIDDSAIEATMLAGPSTHLKRNTVCLNINDGALEASIHAAPSTLHRLPGGACVAIDDSALESTVLFNPQYPPGMFTRAPFCPPGIPGFPNVPGFPRVDEQLEAAAYAGPPHPTTIRLPGGGCLPGIDDSALEAAMTVAAGPTRAGMPGCLTFADEELEVAAAASHVAAPTSFSSPMPACFRIDDGALEATVQAGPQRFPTRIHLPNGGCMAMIDDSTLEQAAGHAEMGPTVQRVAGRCF